MTAFFVLEMISFLLFLFQFIPPFKERLIPQFLPKSMQVIANLGRVD